MIAFDLCWSIVKISTRQHVAPHRDDFRHAHGQYNHVSTLSPKSIEQVIPVKHREGDPTANRSRMNSEEQNMPSLTVDTRIKVLRCILNLQNRSLTVLHTIDSCRQSCDDVKAQASNGWAFQLKRSFREHTLGHLVVVTFRTHVNADTAKIGKVAESTARMQATYALQNRE